MFRYDRKSTCRTILLVWIASCFRSMQGASCCAFPWTTKCVMRTVDISAFAWELIRMVNGWTDIVWYPVDEEYGGFPWFLRSFRLFLSNSDRHIKSGVRGGANGLSFGIWASITRRWERLGSKTIKAASKSFVYIVVVGWMVSTYLKASAYIQVVIPLEETILY